MRQRFACCSDTGRLCTVCVGSARAVPVLPGSSLPPERRREDRVGTGRMNARRALCSDGERVWNDLERWRARGMQRGFLARLVRCFPMGVLDGDKRGSASFRERLMDRHVPAMSAGRGRRFKCPGRNRLGIVSLYLCSPTRPIALCAWLEECFEERRGGVIASLCQAQLSM